MRKMVLVIMSGLLTGVAFVQPAWDIQTQPKQSPEYWEQKGYEDGKSGLALKSTLAGISGCGTGTIGMFVPWIIGVPLIPSGCLGGWGLGHLGQASASPPTNTAGYEAYLRGYRRGVNNSNITSLLIGTGTTLVGVIGVVLITILAVSQ